MLENDCPAKKTAFQTLFKKNSFSKKEKVV